MKLLCIATILILLIGLPFFVFSQESSEAPNETNEVTTETEKITTDVPESTPEVIYPKRKLGIILLASGGGVLGVGMGLLFASLPKEEKSLDLYQSYEAMFPPFAPQDYSAAAATYDEADSERRSVNAMRALGYVSIGLSSVAIGVGMYFMFQKQTVTKPVSWGVYPTQDGGGSYLTFRF